MNELQLSLGPSAQDQKKLDEMMEVARAEIDRPVSLILQNSGFQEANNYNRSLTMTTTAASELNGGPPASTKNNPSSSGPRYHQKS